MKVFQRLQQEPEPSSSLLFLLVHLLHGGGGGPGLPGLTSAGAWSQNQVLVFHVELIKDLQQTWFPRSPGNRSCQSSFTEHVLPGVGGPVGARPLQNVGHSHLGR